MQQHSLVGTVLQFAWQQRAAVSRHITSGDVVELLLLGRFVAAPALLMAPRALLVATGPPTLSAAHQAHTHTHMHICLPHCVAPRILTMGTGAAWETLAV
jgi:hypothetical protein